MHYLKSFEEKVIIFQTSIKSHQSSNIISQILICIFLNSDEHTWLLASPVCLASMTLSESFG